LRIRKNKYIELAPQIWSKLKYLGLNPGFSIYLSGVKLTKNKGFKGANIAAKHRRKYNQKIAKDAWFILTNFSILYLALSGYQKRFGIEEMFRYYKSGGYNLESTSVSVTRLIALIILITFAYTSSIISGEKIKDKKVVKYACRVKEKYRIQRRHRSFYIGIHGYAWVESLKLFHEQTAQLMSLSPHKRPYYQRGRRAETLIKSTF
jgi:hypothetical protein